LSDGAAINTRIGELLNILAAQLMSSGLRWDPVFASALKPLSARTYLNNPLSDVTEFQLTSALI